MNTTIIRHRKMGLPGGIHLSDESRQRAKEYLLSVGYREDDLKPIVWPDDAVSAYRNHSGAPWQFTTKADILRKKRERMESNLRHKRESDGTCRVPLYVWVFWCPGAIFEGWWLYLIGREYESSKFLFRDEELVAQIMELFDIPLFGEGDLENWKAEFVRWFRRGKHGGKPQGKSPVWAEMRNGRLIKLLGRAEWPQRKTIDTDKTGLTKI